MNFRESFFSTASVCCACFKLPGEEGGGALYRVIPYFLNRSRHCRLIIPGAGIRISLLGGVNGTTFTQSPDSDGRVILTMLLPPAECCIIQSAPRSPIYELNLSDHLVRNKYINQWLFFVALSTTTRATYSPLGEINVSIFKSLKNVRLLFIVGSFSFPFFIFQRIVQLLFYKFSNQLSSCFCGLFLLPLVFQAFRHF